MSDSTTPSFLSPTFPSFRTVFSRRYWLGGNWKKEIANSELPADIQSLVHQVVSRSRLRRSEKFDVAEELIQHFQDGHKQGKSLEQLVDKFGDPEAAALLIRRSKIRNRSLVLSTARMIPLFMLGLSIPYLLLLYWYHSGEANPSVDYSAAFNEKALAASEQDKAWPLYRPVWTKYQFSEGARGKYVDMRREHLWHQDENDTRLARPSDEQWPQTVETLEAHKELLATLRTGAKRPVFGLELKPDARQYSDEDFAALFPNAQKETHENYFEKDDPSGILEGAAIGIVLPHVQLIREAARMFHVDARYAVAQGDADRVVKNVETVLGLASQITRTSCIVNSLVGFSVVRIGWNQLEEVIVNDPDLLSEMQLSKLQTSSERVNVHGWLDYGGEKAFFKDTVQRCFTDDGNGDGRLTAAGQQFLDGPFFQSIVGLSGNGSHANPNVPEVSSLERIKEGWNNFLASDFAQSVLAPTNALTRAGRKETLAKAETYFGEIEADQQLPFWESRNAKVDGWKDHQELLDGHKPEYYFLAKLVPSAKHLRNAMERTNARRNGVVFALAMYRYHREHKKWPATAEDLIGSYLNEVPVDILTGQPLLFKIQDDQPVIYSVGLDRDDDGGVDAQANGRSIDREDVTPGPRDDNFEGDWILWPQNAEG